MKQRVLVAVCWAILAPFIMATEPEAQLLEGVQVNPLNVNAPATAQIVLRVHANIRNSPFSVREMALNGSAQQITAINYGFVNVRDHRCVSGIDKVPWGRAGVEYWGPVDRDKTLDGQVDQGDHGLYGQWNQLKQLKARYPHLKVIASIGGWDFSQYISKVAKPEYRADFVKSCIDAYIRGNVAANDGFVKQGLAAGVFDGFDLDWEYPAVKGKFWNLVSPQDTPNYTALIAEFRRQLNAVNPELLLTATVPASADKIAKIEVSKVAPMLNWLNVMSFNFVDADSPTVRHGANLQRGEQDAQSVSEVINSYLNAGAPAQKLVMGIPFYGFGWEVAPSNQTSLYRSVIRKAHGPQVRGEAPYDYIAQLPGETFRDDLSGASWKVSGNEVWVYDDLSMVQSKARWAAEQRLGGVMAWTNQQGAPNAILIDAIDHALHP